MEKYYPAVIAAVLFCAFSIYKEFIRLDRGRLFLRISAVIVLSASLLFLQVPIHMTATKRTHAKEMLLLTPGFKNKLLRTESYFTADSSILKELGPNRVNYLPDLSYYLRAHPEVSVLKVYGYGLESNELAKLDVHKYQFIPSSAPAGISSISWPREIPASAELKVQGVYENQIAAPLKLILTGAGTRLDSTTISKGQKSSFSLSYRPKQLGKAVYHLIAEQKSKQLGSEKIPFQVVENPKLKIMVLASSPDFEYKFLRNWLFENNYPAYFKTRISMDKFNIDVLNLASKQPQTFNASMFKNFDLVIADDEELETLSPNTRASLNKEILNGLGLFIRINESKRVSSFAKTFKIKRGSDRAIVSIVPVITTEFKRLSAISVNDPLYIQQDQEQLGLITDVEGNVLLSSKLSQKGRISATTFGSAYKWQLSGAKNDFAQYWSEVINKTARKHERKLSWAAKPQFPLAGERVSIAFQTEASTALPRFSVNDQIESVQKHPILPFFWQGFAWVDHAGWNKFQVEDQTIQDFFVYKPEDWTAVKVNDKILYNQKFANSSQKSANTQEYGKEKVKVELSKWWFFSLLMLSIGFLWLEARYAPK